MPASVETRKDGRCGRDFNWAICDPIGEFGGCCSKDGYCGWLADHCLVEKGCQTGCSSSLPALSVLLDAARATSSVRPDSISSRAAAATSPPSSLPSITTNGSCGAMFGGVVCGDWISGSCCSMYGFCGNSTSHCGDGCQSGPCIGHVRQVRFPLDAPENVSPGQFKVVGNSGVPAMHTGLLPNGRAVFLDKVEPYTELNLTDGRNAFSSEYDTFTNQITPLSYKTNAFCSGGAFLSNGSFLSVGGSNATKDFDSAVEEGYTGIRMLDRSPHDSSLDGTDWVEGIHRLSSKRWYPTAQTLPDGSILVASGSRNGFDPSIPSNNNPTYELLDPRGVPHGESIPMEILANNQPYYMYPFIHLLPDSSLFIFTAKSAELFSVTSNSTIRTLPDLPGDYRTYPNTGGTVLLPLSSATNWEPEVIICGGGAYQDLWSPTDHSCGRIKPLAADPSWTLESMPAGRTMVEGTLLPDGTVAWLNGCRRGAQGWEIGAEPSLEALLYDPSAPESQRFTRAGRSDVPRMYHSVATLLLDGTVLVAGSNPLDYPVFAPSEEHPFPTEFRVEIYTPPYLQGDAAERRPADIRLSATELRADGSRFEVDFNAPEGATDVSVVLYHGGFEPERREQRLAVTMPPNSNVAPPGPIGQFVLVS
ncbi:glyoxal oxidase N-terminus-domain-containing protein [Lineolata rhizophorae]|uniref:Glyoxal oxidase N-terminus-domain-containing protein n=1 Tax=Lineolata rhizophorae TaxID=578093 RepID=A0A6A6PAA1_9PEZI|nr:glyoxal oxidase N-terminus-domain-containing protein [Lineolata rhizophorae]